MVGAQPFPALAFIRGIRRQRSSGRGKGVGSLPAWDRVTSPKALVISPLGKEQHMQGLHREAPSADHQTHSSTTDLSCGTC